MGQVESTVTPYLRVGEGQKTWCFFELDRTLIAGRSFPRFLLSYLRAHPVRAAAGVFFVLRFLRVSVRKGAKGSSGEAALATFLRGAKRSALQQQARAFWLRFFPANHNPDMVKRLVWHSREGHSVYLLTGAVDFIAEPLAELLPLSGVIATRSRWAGDTFTGGVEGRVCSGLEKMERLRRELGLELTACRYYVYTADEADLPLLVYTDRGFFLRERELYRWEKRAGD